MDKIDGGKYYKSLPEEEQNLIYNVMVTTIDMCNSLSNDPVIFTEAMAYRAFRNEMIGHMLNKEWYDPKDKCWKK